jgi:hypothetical protein
MRLSAWHRAKGDTIHFHRSATRGLFDPNYAAVYGSAIFSFTAERLARFQRNFPEAIVGGTGTTALTTVEQIIGGFDGLDYLPWPEFKASIGFTQRGCRLSCKFCVVPAKEGKPQSVATVADIWRGEPWPKHLHLLDNDFFGQPKWRERIAEIRDGAFKVCFNQGINVRAVTDEVAEALATVQYRDMKFSERRLYTAWDNLKDEKVFFEGVDCLERAGVPAKHLRAYMLIGFAKGETMERIERRFSAMVARGIEPFPMVYGENRALKKFQRWAVTGLYRAVPFAEYDANARKGDKDPMQQSMEFVS